LITTSTTASSTRRRCSAYKAAATTTTTADTHDVHHRDTTAFIPSLPADTVGYSIGIEYL
jgi:hypothetical protein